MTYLFWLVFLIVGNWTPWWFVFVLGFGTGLMNQTLKGAVRDAFFGGGFSALFIMTFFEFKNSMIVSNRLAKVFSLNSGWLFLSLAALFFGFVCSICGALGFWQRTFIFKSRDLSQIGASKI